MMVGVSYVFYYTGLCNETNNVPIGIVVVMLMLMMPCITYCSLIAVLMAMGCTIVTESCRHPPLSKGAALAVDSVNCSLDMHLAASPKT